MSDPSGQARMLRDRGYAVFPSAFDDRELAALSATMTRLHQEAGSPSCFSREPRRLTPEIELCPTGLVFYKFIKRCPEHAGLIARAEIIATIRGYLGQEMTLELTGAVIADASRPFFAWHTHIGGIDDGKYRRAGIWPQIDVPQRLMTLLYVDALDDENGPLLVYPRRVGDPTPPPHDPDAREWPGALRLTLPRGSVVLLDECTWHAVVAKRSPGIRSFIGCYFRTASAPATEWDDDSLPGFVGGGELLQSILPRR